MTMRRTCRTVARATRGFRLQFAGILLVMTTAAACSGDAATTPNTEGQSVTVPASQATNQPLTLTTDPAVTAPKPTGPLPMAFARLATDAASATDVAYLSDDADAVAERWNLGFPLPDVPAGHTLIVIVRTKESAGLDAGRLDSYRLDGAVLHIAGTDFGPGDGCLTQDATEQQLIVAAVPSAGLTEDTVIDVQWKTVPGPSCAG